MERSERKDRNELQIIQHNKYQITIYLFNIDQFTLLSEAKKKCYGKTFSILSDKINEKNNNFFRCTLEQG